MNREHGKSVNDSYENDFVTKGTFGKRTTDETQQGHTTRIQSSELTGSDDVMIRYSRAAAVVFVLLCVLLLTARIILCATFTQERQQLLTKITNLTEEREQLLTKITNLTEERQQLLTKITNLTEEREQFKSERNELQKCFEDGCQGHQSSLYFISSERKTWTESRRYCRERGADLIIINNTEEQDFVKNITGSSEYFWIGLTDIEVEDRWKWVDGSTLTSGFWASGEPNGYWGKEEDCALNYSPGWADYPCDYMSKWICEKNILK